MSRNRKTKAPVLADSEERERDDLYGGHRDFRHWFNAQFPIDYGNTPLTQLPCLLSLAGFIRVRVAETQANDVYVVRFGCSGEWTLDTIRDHLLGVFSRMGYRVPRKEVVLRLERRRVMVAVWLPRWGEKKVLPTEEVDPVEY